MGAHRAGGREGKAQRPKSVLKTQDDVVKRIDEGPVEVEDERRYRNTLA